MKKIVWDNPNKMHMDSGYILFDKQTNVISTGNIIANTERGFYIAPWKETDRNYAKYKPGHLCKADLKFGGFNENSLPVNIKQIVFDKGREESVLLYAFRVWKNHKEDVIGYVLTDKMNNYITHTVIWKYGCNNWKREMAVNEARKYVCN